MRYLVVYCHPVPESFCAAVRDTAVAALSDRGCEVRLTDLYAEGFDPVLGADERRNMDRAPTDPKLAPHIDSIKWAQAIVFVYPTWWYGLPAMLKGWLDRVWATDVVACAAHHKDRRRHHLRRAVVDFRVDGPTRTQNDIARHARALRADGPHALCRALRHGPLHGRKPHRVPGEGEAESRGVLGTSTTMRRIAETWKELRPSASQAFDSA